MTHILLLIFSFIQLSTFSQSKLMSRDKGKKEKVVKHAAYLMAEHKNLSEVKKRLTANQLEVLGSANVAGSPLHNVIFFTTPDLQNLASKKKRGFAGVLRILIDDQNKSIVVSNPDYFLRAFLQDDFDKSVADTIVAKLGQALGDLKPNEDQLKEKSLAGYRFMVFMPYYEDFQTVGDGPTEQLLSRIETNAKNQIVFKKKLGNSYLLAVTMPKNVESLVEKLEVQKKSGFLPYFVLIEENKAYILHPKYYLAISLPKLSMGEFMGISEKPDEIKDFFSSLFK